MSPPSDDASDSEPELYTTEKRSWGNRKKMAIALSAAITLTIVLGVLIYFMTLGVGTTCACGTPSIGTNKGTTMTATTFTVSAISGAAAILKADVYVNVVNAAGATVIPSIPLVLHQGGFDFLFEASKGFNYTSASNGNYVSVGDVFSLDSTMYSQGSVMTLYELDKNGQVEGQYCVLTV